MWKLTFALSALACLPAGAVAAQPAGVQVAQECGYFAILGCYREQGAAEDWNDKIEFGHVIDTSSMRYPNFQPGYYCVVHGPTSRRRAEEIARGWRRFIPGAYVKSSC